MKCPHCGNESEVGKVCGKCGKEVAAAPKMEVEYKDFKCSELLDIKMAAAGSSAKEVEHPAETAGLETGGKKDPPVRYSLGKYTLFSIAILLLIAALAVFYLIRFLAGF